MTDGQSLPGPPPCQPGVKTQSPHLPSGTVPSGPWLLCLLPVLATQSVVHRPAALVATELLRKAESHVHLHLLDQSLYFHRCFSKSAKSCSSPSQPHLVLQPFYPFSSAPSHLSLKCYYHIEAFQTRRLQVVATGFCILEQTQDIAGFGHSFDGSLEPPCSCYILFLSPHVSYPRVSSTRPGTGQTAPGTEKALCKYFWN